MNSDIRIAVSFLDHKKTIKLQRRLGADGVLCLVRLWCYTAQNKPDGILSGMDAEDIEIAAKWNGEVGAFVSTLKEVEWLDHDEIYSIHDWKEHNPYAFHAKSRQKQARKAAAARYAKPKSEHAHSMQTALLNTDGSTTPVPSPLPTPIPIPKDLDVRVWDRWKAYREEIRKPLKPASILAAQRKLAAFGSDQEATVEQSIANGWTGLFELNTKKQPTKNIADGAI